MEHTRAGWYEYQVEAELAHEFLRSGAQAVAYSSIVAGGPNACVLHYRDNNRQLQDGELLLIDAGCEYHGYASDITRTFPVNGKFSGPQKAIYELVLAAQQACIDAVKPGADFHDYHKVAERVLAQGYIDLGLCKGTLDDVLANGSYKQFYMHRAGHWLGMDVHDAGALSGARRLAEARAGHGAHRRAGHLHPTGGQRPVPNSGTSACASRTTFSVTGDRCRQSHRRRRRRRWPTSSAPAGADSGSPPRAAARGLHDAR